MSGRDPARADVPQPPGGPVAGRGGERCETSGQAGEREGAGEPGRSDGRDGPADDPGGRDVDGRFAVLASETVYTGKVMTVRVDDVAMPGGGFARREVAEHQRAVAVVAIDDRGQVVLIEQYRHPLRRRLWELPAGLMDVPGEKPLACAVRELLEETGLAAERWSVLVDLASSPGFCTEVIRVYLARGLRTVPAPPAREEEADMRVVRVPLADAVIAVLDGRIVNASAVAGLLAAARVLGAPAEADLRGAAGTWIGGPASVNDGPLIVGAPALGARPWH